MSKNILVIDDDEVIRMSFKLTLEDTEYEVDAAESGMIALEKFQQGNFNLIFLDLRMPNMDGIEILRKVREIDKNVPIYIVTAFQNEYLEELKKAQADNISFEILNKPVSRYQIIEVVKASC